MRELGSIRSIKEGGVRFWLRRSFRFLVLSQLLVALGAAGMAWPARCCKG
jgi:hypothetical protein